MRCRSAFGSRWVLLILVGTLGLEAATFPVIRWEGRTMGSPYLVQIVGTNLSEARVGMLKAEVEQRLQEINRQMSHYQPASELSRFNRTSPNQPVRVSPEFAQVVRFALDLSQRSGGAFDPTLGALINLWGFGEKTEERAVPSEAELEAARRTCGWSHLAVTAGNDLSKDLAGLAVNLSAVAKGFGVDEMARVLGSHGLSNLYVSIAGEVVLRGHNPQGTNWQVGISLPTEHWREGDPMAGVASLSNRAISTSGDYQKFFRDARGRRLSHILDPRTGWPVQHDLAGVSVVAPDSMTADGLATTLFVLGAERGLPFIEAWADAAALFLVRESDGRFRQIVSSRFTALAGYRP